MGKGKKGAKKVQEAQAVPTDTQSGAISFFNVTKRYGFLLTADKRSFFFNQADCSGEGDLRKAKTTGKQFDFLVQAADPKKADAKPFAFNIRPKGYPDPKAGPFSWKGLKKSKRSVRKELIGDDQERPARQQKAALVEEPEDEDDDELEDTQPQKKKGKRKNASPAEAPAKKKRKAQ